MEANKATTDEWEASKRVNKTAETLREVLSGWNVTVQEPYGVKDRVTFAVYQKDDLSTNGYAKGSVINTVLKEVPALEVDSTEDGNMAVTFCYVNQ